MTLGGDIQEVLFCLFDCLHVTERSFLMCMCVLTCKSTNLPPTYLPQVC